MITKILICTGILFWTLNAFAQETCSVIVANENIKQSYKLRVVP